MAPTSQKNQTKKRVESNSISQPIQKEILCDGWYYDVTEFARRHPGGSIIDYYTKTGEDATLAIQQFHQRSPAKIKAILKSFKRRPAEDKEGKGFSTIIANFKTISQWKQCLHLIIYCICSFRWSREGSKAQGTYRGLHKVVPWIGKRRHVQAFLYSQRLQNCRIVCNCICRLSPAFLTKLHSQIPRMCSSWLGSRKIGLGSTWKWSSLFDWNS